MLLKLGVLIVLVLAAFIFLGIKMSENIKQQEIKMLFFALYGMTIFTIFNLVISVYFFAALRDKRGPAGPKGKKGEMGDKGVNSACDQTSCLRKSLQNIIVNYLETRTATTVAGSPEVPDPISLTGEQRTMICSMTEQLDETSLRKILPPDGSSNITKIEGILNLILDNDIETSRAQLVSVAGVLGFRLVPANIQHEFCK